MERLLLLVGLGMSAMLPLVGKPGYAQKNGTAVRIIQGAEPRAHADILSLKRTEGGLLTLRIAFANETGGEIKNKELPGGGNVENFSLSISSTSENTTCCAPPTVRVSALH